MDGRTKLLYILAPSFSGSTLLTYLLARHPRIATIGELKATPMGDVEKYRCSCGELITQCAFWREVTRRCRDLGVEFDVRDFDTVLNSRAPLTNKLLRAEVRGPAFEVLRRVALGVWPGARADLKRQLRRNHELTRVLLELQGGDVFLDGSKDATRLMHFVDSGLWDVRVIYLQRDGRGVTASIAKHGSLPFAEAAEQWAYDLRGLENMRRRLPANVVTDLKYEELCRDPAGTLERLFVWLGVEPVPVTGQNFKDGAFHILGNSMRLTGVGEIRSDESWRSKLDDGQKDYFVRKFGHLHRKLGYS